MVLLYFDILKSRWSQDQRLFSLEAGTTKPRTAPIKSTRCYEKSRVLASRWLKNNAFATATITSDSRAAARPAAYARHGRASACGSNCGFNARRRVALLREITRFGVALAKNNAFATAIISSDSRVAARPAAYARHGRASACGSNCGFNFRRRVAVI